MDFKKPLLAYTDRLTVAGGEKLTVRSAESMKMFASFVRIIYADTRGHP